MIHEQITEMKSVAAKTLERSVGELLEKAGSSNDDAATVAEALVWADLRARHPQGVLRLPTFVERLRHGAIRSPARMEWTRVVAAAEMLDAADAFGHVAGKAAMMRAIEIARLQGVGVVTVKRSNLNGALGYFCSLAADAGCIGMTCTNGYAKVAPFGGVRPVFGTNPIAFGCPTSSGVPILVDFSTRAIAGSTSRGLGANGRQLPDGVALDKHGLPTVHEKELAEGTLLSAAGAKGYGLALMVEILCGVLAGAALSKEVGSVFASDTRANVGHMVLAIDVEKFQPMDMFLSRIETLSASVNAAGNEVRIPGSIRGQYAERYSRDGIPLPKQSRDALTRLARELHVELTW
jgi:LDH2 family malate/lactate/ureidoglycolate dehydrogenase